MSVSDIRTTRTTHSRRMLRLGGWIAIAGTILSVVVNVLHPHQNIPTDPFMLEVHETSYWIPLHIGIVFAQLLDLVAMLAIGRTLRKSMRSDLVRYADGAAIVAAAVMLTLMGQDGFATKHIADYYETTTGAAHVAAYPVAYAFLLLLLAGLGLWYLVFFGVAMPLYAIAQLRSTFYPRWIGLLGLGSGICGLITGSLIYTLGSSFLVTTLMFLVFSFLGFLWLLVTGLHMLSVAKAPAGDAQLGADEVAEPALAGVGSGASEGN
ncbi:MAG TPA: hypothetical protein VHZ97_30730 [Pseudonocardiaceae bacterium]|jgi:hypothetical protein|nr:hypothetical protein [Pseudonocardiaceae bacterium]